MDFSTIKLFDDESGNAIMFDTLLKDIYKTSKSKKGSIESIVNNMIDKVKNAADAAMLGPVIAEYVEIGIKNDDQLVKLAQIIQRATARVTVGLEKGSGGLTSEEVLELKQIARETVTEDYKESSYS